jgi:hypothetical protein
MESTPTTSRSDSPSVANLVEGGLKTERKSQRANKYAKVRTTALGFDLCYQACVDLFCGKNPQEVRERLVANKEHFLETLRWAHKELGKPFDENNWLPEIQPLVKNEHDNGSELLQLKRERLEDEDDEQYEQLAQASEPLERVSLPQEPPEPKHWGWLVDVMEFREPSKKRIALRSPVEQPPSIHNAPKLTSVRNLLKDGNPRCFDCRRDLLGVDPGYATLREVCRDAINRTEGRIESHRPVLRFPLPPMPFEDYKPSKIPVNGHLLTILEEDPADPLEEIPGFKYSVAARGGIRVWNIEPHPRYPVEFLYPILKLSLGQRCSWPAKKNLVFETRYMFDIDDVYDQGMLMVFNCNARHSSTIAKELSISEQQDYDRLRKERAFLARSLLEQRRPGPMGGPSHDVGLFDAQQRFLNSLQRFHCRRFGISWDWSPWSKDPTFTSYWVPAFALKALERVEWQDGRFVSKVSERRRGSKQLYPNRSWEGCRVPKDGPICFNPDLCFQLWDYEFKKYIWIFATSATIYDDAHFADQIAYYCDIQNGNHPIQRAMLWEDCFRKVFFQFLQFGCRYRFEPHDGLIFSDDGWSMYSRTSLGRSQVQPPNLVFKIQGEHYAWWRSPNFFHYKDPIGTAMLLHIESDFVLYGNQSRIEWSDDDRRWDPVVPTPTPLPGWDKAIDTRWLEE